MSNPVLIKLYSDLLNKEVEVICNEVKASIDEVNKLALSQAWKILQLTSIKIVQILESVATDLSGPDKKNIALTSLSLFYDKVLKSVSIPMIPYWIEPILHRYVKQILMLLISSSIDVTVSTFRELGIFISKRTKKISPSKELIPGYQGYQGYQAFSNTPIKPKISKKRKKQ